MATKRKRDNVNVEEDGTPCASSRTNYEADPSAAALALELADMKDLLNQALSKLDHVQHEINSLKKTNARLEDRCESLEQFVDVLKKNWKYSAPSIPSSYWFEQGHGEMYVTFMNTFLKDIRK